MKATVRNLSFSPKMAAKGHNFCKVRIWSIKNPPNLLKTELNHGGLL